MCSLASWNIRGLNRSLKQKEVRQVISDSKIQVCAILETHVDSSKLVQVCKRVFRSWQWCSNGSVCDKGARIILGWDADVVDVMLVSLTTQVLNVQIVIKDESKVFFRIFCLCEKLLYST